MQLVRAMGMALVVMMVVSAIGCGGSDSGGGSIVGTWTDGDVAITFGADGTLSASGMALGTYSTSGSTLTLTFAGESESMGYSVSGNKLTLSQGGESMVYTKV